MEIVVFCRCFIVAFFSPLLFDQLNMPVEGTCCAPCPRDLILDSRRFFNWKNTTPPIDVCMSILQIYTIIYIIKRQKRKKKEKKKNGHNIVGEIDSSFGTVVWLTEKMKTLSISNVRTAGGGRVRPAGHRPAHNKARTYGPLMSLLARGGVDSHFLRINETIIDTTIIFNCY